MIIEVEKVEEEDSIFYDSCTIEEEGMKHDHLKF